MNPGRIFAAILLLGSAVYADFDWRAENSNFTLSQASLVPEEDERYLYNYDRFRVRADWKEEAFFVTGIGDLVNYLGEGYTDSLSFSYIRHLHSDTPFKTQTSFYDYDKGTFLPGSIASTAATMTGRIVS